MAETIGLLEEALQLARDLGYRVREESLGDLPGGRCVVGGTRQVLLNVEHTVAERLDHLLRAIRDDARLSAEPMSRLLAERLRAIDAES